MFGDWKIMAGIVTIAVIGSFFSLMSGFVLMLAVTVLYFMAFRKYVPPGMDSPLKPNEVHNIHVTKSLKIKFRRLIEEKGFLRLPRSKTPLMETGEYYVISENTQHSLRGRPAFITIEGIAHTMRLEYAFLAALMSKLKIQTKEQLAAFLGVPVEMITGETQEEKKEGEKVGTKS